jgi:phosphoglycerate dehydrogenase-like enzyme
MQKWHDISIDFIVDLPSSNGFTNIMVKSINAISVAEYFVKYVFKLHRLLNLIISDCKSQFVLDF